MINYTRVKDLIEKLQKFDPEAIVLHAYDEYGRTGVHGFISGELNVFQDPNTGNICDSENEVLECEPKYFPKDYTPEFVEQVKGFTQIPAIKLFAE